MHLKSFSGTRRLVLFCFVLLFAGAFLQKLQAQEEEALFLTARADQTGSANGGTVIWSFPQNTWRWWYKDTKQANVSPDGKRVVYIFNDNLYLTDIKGQAPKLLSKNASVPLWSPQGDRIAFIYMGNTLQIVSPTGALLQSFPDVYGATTPS